jgi:hypothetical protein
MEKNAPSVATLQVALKKYALQAKSRTVARLDANLLDGEPNYVFLIHEWLLDLDRKVSEIHDVLNPSKTE